MLGLGGIKWDYGGIIDSISPPQALQPFLPPLLGSLLTLLCSPPTRDHPDPEDAELWGGGEGGRSIRHCAAQVSPHRPLY